jgi:Aldehyde oxidase and xanthine dehydrogenase, a/b hammerhead domain
LGEIDVVFDFEAAGIAARDRQTGSAARGRAVADRRRAFCRHMSLPGQAYACLLRSPHAHAKIAGIDVGPATGLPGVIAVLTGSDTAEDSLRPIPHRPVPANPHEVPLDSRDGSPFFIAPHPVLAVEKVRYVGEPVAMVVADTLPQAMDAAERVEIVCDVLPAIVGSADALEFRSGQKKKKFPLPPSSSSLSRGPSAHGLDPWGRPGPISPPLWDISVIAIPWTRGAASRWTPAFAGEAEERMSEPAWPIS